MSEKIRFIDKDRSAFFVTLRRRIDEYFETNNISKHANGFMVFKTVFYLTSFFVLYGLIISNQFTVWPMLGMAILLGMVSAFIGFNVCHDAIHGSYSANENVNNFLSYFFYLIGANVYVWKLTHNVVHHVYTNIPGHDEDIEIAPGLLRVTNEDKLKGIHKYQHFYGFFLYSFASLSWVLRKDYKKFFQKNVGQTENNPPAIEVFKLFFFKFVYYIMFIVVPLLVLDIAWWQFIIGFLIMHAAEGLTLGLVFQLAHLVENTDIVEPNAEGNIESAWAIHQMKTTANFASDSAIATFLCGGLNMQVEHHMFPKICHIHYQKLVPIVRETAKEFGVPYHENPTFLSALHSHYLVLKHYGADALEAAKA
jgi:linoleoyl-CoA desaturase